jgi:hypothetical protein
VLAAEQAGIRTEDESHAQAWEGLGAAYRSLGRLTAALKVRAVTSFGRQLFSLFDKMPCT